MKEYRITVLLKDGRELDKVDQFESYESARQEAKRVFDKYPFVIAYEVECLDE